MSLIPWWLWNLLVSTSAPVFPVFQKRLEEDLCWTVPHVPPTTQSAKGLNWTEPKEDILICRHCRQSTTGTVREFVTSWLTRWTVHRVAKGPSTGLVQMKERFSVLPSLHLYRVVSACLALVCTACIKIVAHDKDSMSTFESRMSNGRWRYRNSQITHNTGRKKEEDTSWFGLLLNWIKK